MYNPPRPPEVYTLPDAVNEAMPPDIRRKFQHDGNDRVLFFTAPPLDRRDNGIAPGSCGLGHSAKYLAGRKEWLAERDKKRKERGPTSDHDVRHRPSPSSEFEADNDPSFNQAKVMFETRFRDFDRDTIQWHRDAGFGGLYKA